MSLQLHKPDEQGVMRPEPGAAPDYRDIRSQAFNVWRQETSARNAA